MPADLATHWDNAYASKGEEGVSWFEKSPDFSLGLIKALSAGRDVSVIDIGGGASRLVDLGLREGWSFAVLDVSENALETARKRLDVRADAVEWIVADVTKWEPSRTFDVWHDRAAFHFLTDPGDRAAYVERLRQALKPGGHAIIATFAPDGPERCSGLPIVRYDGLQLAETVGDAFRLVAEHRKMHRTPWGSEQSFQFSVFLHA
jgi:SAM-dependent methyltransferase